VRAAIVDEAEALAPVESAQALACAAAGRFVAEPYAHVAHDDSARLLAGVGGDPRPEWFDGLVLTIGQTVLARVADTYVLPGFGTVIDGEGRIFEAGVGEVRNRWPDLSGLPHVRPEADAWRFDPPARAPRLGPTAVFAPWGGQFNYGHFLLDGLCGLLALEEAALLESHTPLMAPMKPWQAALIGLGFPGLQVRTTRAPVIRAEAAVFANTLDQFLHEPNELVVRLRERMLAGAPAGRGARRVYFSRRGQPMRVMVNEAELEAALRRRGFAIVRPERLSPPEQIALVRDAEVVVGPTGAAFANVAFAAPGARVVEITPHNYASHWVLALSRLVEADWRPFYCRAPCAPSEVPLNRRLRNYVFAYRLPLEPFLAHLDALL